MTDCQFPVLLQVPRGSDTYGFEDLFCTRESGHAGLHVFERGSREQ